jgi:hypothetical protein
MVEIRFDVDFFRQASRSLPALAVRLFDDDGQTWVAWPRVSHRAHPSEVERHPSDWAPVRLD